MVIIIYLGILLINVVAVFMVYKFLGTDKEKKEKLIFIAIGTSIMYVTVSFVYWLSTKNVDFGDIRSYGENFITFTFVPINSMITLTYIAKSYKYFREGRLKQDKFRNRVILMIAVLVVVLIIEFFYFKDIQTGILNIINSKK